ncbi:PKD domain-containing protein [bacterium]|nr:PKD domain-containing protein [bacterium]
MVCDKVSKAYDRMDQDYNFAGYPSMFLDGGDEVFVGGPSTATPVRNAINACGARAVDPLDMIVATDWLGNRKMKVRVKIGNGVPANTAPPVPSAPTGPTTFAPNQPQNFTAALAEPDADSLLIQFDFGDGGVTDWLGPYASGGDAIMAHTYQAAGNYEITFRVNDRYGEITDWSPTLAVEVRCCIGFTGNTNGDAGGAVDLSDLIYLVNYLFLGGPAPLCDAGANINGDVGCAIDLSDLIYLVNYLFLGGPAPAACDVSCE